MSRHELVERFSLERVVPSPATFDYKKLDWMNGAYLRELQPDEYAHFLCKWLTEQGIEWPQDTVHATAPLVQEKIEKFSQYPDFVRFLFEDVAPDGADPTIAPLHSSAWKRWNRGRRPGSRKPCARWPMSSARSRATHSRRSGSRSPARRCRPVSSRASSCSVATGRSHVCAPLAAARLSERLRRRERVEGPLEAPPGLEAIVHGRARELAHSIDVVAGSTPTGVRRDLPFLKMKRSRSAAGYGR